ncbi:hypothetical protein CA234_13050 [Sphingomonas sp. ABOLE]|uniref:hypothetical protein n=1 Tax=Sphingomonas sp. ABOLE TaxID=1985878 RepID=UPI000F7F3A83|nr:hypothetical protein [Sphingomonas sp. ABOLE]RSV39939.1 hypothetical protein CA234_13050 [Sphingomonas sp. ABOLE]
MIIDVPSPHDFQAAGLSQLYLAWQIAMHSVQDYESATAQKGSQPIEQREVEEFWRRSQPALANAFSLVQQGMELALKGRIAAVSPFLLLGDPADWPKNSVNSDVSFGDFRTIDAKDLSKVHNCVCPSPLDEQFRNFWDQVRRDRNRIMHSVTVNSFDPALLVRTILTAACELFAETPWQHRLAEMVADGRYEAFGYDKDTHNMVLSQLDIAVRHLTPAEAQHFFGFDKRRRAYVCPHCYRASNRDWQVTWPKLAQLTDKTHQAKSLGCFVCGETTQVERVPCHSPECLGDVIGEEICLTCTLDQSCYFDADSGLTDADLSSVEYTYRFVFSRGVAGAGGTHAQGEALLANDRNAKGHAAYVLRQGHLQVWNAVTILHVESREPFYAPPKERVLGYWRRQGSDLEWVAGLRADTPDWDAGL